MISRGEQSQQPNIPFLRRHGRALAATGVLTLAACNVGLSIATQAELSGPVAAKEKPGRIETPCVVEDSRILQQTADGIADNWRAKGVGGFSIKVLYIPEMPTGGCQTRVDGEVEPVSGSQYIRGHNAIAVTPRISMRASELELIARHESGHVVAAARGQNAKQDRVVDEALADCYAGVSSQGLSDATLQDHQTALYSVGGMGGGDPHGTGEQRVEYFAYGYAHGDCDPKALIATR